MRWCSLKEPGCERSPCRRASCTARPVTAAQNTIGPRVPLALPGRPMKSIVWDRPSLGPRSTNIT